MPDADDKKRALDFNPFQVDIRVPYADERRNYLLADRWQGVSGDVPPPPGMRLPAQSSGHFVVRIKRYSILDLTIENQYCDALIGKTGMGSGHGEGQIGAHFTFQGEWSFTSASQAATVGPTGAYLRWNDRPWDFQVAHRTHSLALKIPIREINPRVGSRTLLISQKEPSVRLLLAHLRNCIELGQFGIAARNATIELFQGVIDDRVIDDQHLSSALVKAAKECIESRLLGDPDMDPESIASALHVSVRTLNRAFEHEMSSVMAYARSRRLARARSELMSTSWTVSELAARWHFTDSSHFIRAYKKQYGETPAELRRAPRLSLWLGGIGMIIRLGGEIDGAGHGDDAKFCPVGIAVIGRIEGGSGAADQRELVDGELGTGGVVFTRRFPGHVRVDLRSGESRIASLLRGRAARRPAQ